MRGNVQICKLCSKNRMASYVELNIGSSHKVDTEHFNRSMVDS